MPNGTRSYKVPSMILSDKRQKGQFFTQGNPFGYPAFLRWAKLAGLPQAQVLEPFAGANGLIAMLRKEKLCREFISYDIAPASRQVRHRDTMADFPTGFSVCVTNPPWLARNSATRRGLNFPATGFDDVYKHCLRLCLSHCQHVAAIVPASFLQSGLFRSRLHTYILLHGNMFNDTENPACLALFGEPRKQVQLFYDEDYIGALDMMEQHLPQEQKQKMPLKFNCRDGALGFISFDNNRQASIRFCDAKELEGRAIKHSSRFITRISGNFHNLGRLVARLNDRISAFRIDTRDIFLTPFKGIRNDGVYRRRMEYGLARKFIHEVS